MNPQNLSRRVTEIISNIDAYEEMLLSAISPWEFSKLLEKQRIGISCNPEDWINIAIDMPKLRVTPLSPILLSLNSAPSTFS
jgi:PIN domain nuclease of toxin-antitoxin system